ncbi:MAG: sigma 54-interacting transcriptional regulator, partial [Candidatus Rokubacteria bacterium]|nr:sigma 54-interacting transcriptional regulator [Candidatus Rokubacteria bacterium]
GAFTGAVARKEGLLALAHGGTVFLDEVGELPLEAQAMLLRFLENGELRPVGSTRTTRVDERVIAATNRDLEQAVTRREFREDLYDRLTDIVLEVPPLRARREDTPLPIEHFRILFNGKHALAIEGLRPEALAAMMAHEWSGNVRALSKALKEAMVLREEGWIQQGVDSAGRPQDREWPTTREAIGRWRRGAGPTRRPGRATAASEQAAGDGAENRSGTGCREPPSTR